MVDLQLHNRTKSRVYTRAFFARVARAAAPHLKTPAGAQVQVGLVLIGPTAMRTLNRRYRKTDKPTDVLSFALPTPKLKGYTAVSLGDVFICPAVVRAKAKLWNRPERAQMQWSFVHGLLHLAGYDHEKSATAARRMSALEQRILGKLATSN